MDEHQHPYPDAKWHLESFDLRGGLAFATLQPKRTSTPDVREWPCYFIGPPDFSPEPLDNVSVALGATRAGFDSALLIGEREATFETLEAVAEFVRRAYVSGSSGDGGDGPTGVPTPLPPSPDAPPNPEGPQGPTVSESFDRDSDRHMAREVVWGNVEAFAKLVSGTSPDRSFRIDWTAIESCEPGTVLLRGALLTLRELTSRATAGSPADEMRWVEDALALGRAIDTLGLWPALFTTTPFRDQTRAVMASVRMPPGLNSGQVLTDGYAVFLGSAWWPRSRFRNDPLSQAHLFRDITQPSLASWTDPVEFLARMPIPLSFGVLAGVGPGGQTSLWHLLSSFIASPQVALAQMSEHDSLAVVDLVLFAAACIACAGGRPVPPHRRGALGRGVDDQAVRDRGEATMQWLASQLPRRGFESALEERIHMTKDVRYFQSPVATGAL